MREFRAVVTDLDGTLVRTDKTLTDYTVRVLEKCRERGVAVLAATARPERSMADVLSRLHFDAMATLNGARILLPGRVLENAIDHTTCRSILEKLLALPDAVLSLETAEGFFANKPIPAWQPILFSGFPSLPTSGAVYKILLSGRGLQGAVEAALTEDTYCTVAEGMHVQVMSRAATKWNGIREMLDCLGLRAEETVYFGDDNDDVEPLMRCGLGVAVSNAIERAREAADEIAPSNDEDGPARFLERLFQL